MLSGSTRPAWAARAVITAPASSAGVAASNSPRDPAHRRCPARPTRCTHRATPPGRPTCTVRSAVPMSTPSSRLVLVTTARISPHRSAASIARSFPHRAPSDARPRFDRVLLDLMGPAQVVCELFGEGAGVGEDDGGAVTADDLAQPAQQPAIGEAAVR